MNSIFNGTFPFFEFPMCYLCIHRPGCITLVLTEANHKKDRRCNQGIIGLLGKWKKDEIKGALVFEAELAK